MATTITKNTTVAQLAVKSNLIPVLNDYSANVHTSGVVAIGESTLSTISFAYDNDWFAVSLKAGDSYHFNVTGNSLVDPILDLVDSSGNVLLSNDDISSSNKNSYLTFTSPTDGTYYLAVKGIRDTMGTYSVSVLNDDFKSDITTSTILSLGESKSGVVETQSDQDWFAVSLVQGQSYNFSLKGNTLVDPVLSLLKSNGDLITSNDDVYGGNTNSYINFTADTTGTYYLAAQGLREKTGSYFVDANIDDHKNDITTLDLVSVGGSSSGVIESVGDQDVFAVSLVQGQSYNFSLKGNTLSDSVLNLLNSHGDLIISNDDVYGGNRNSYISFTADTTGTYYLSANGLRDKTGSYAIDVSLDDHRNDITTVDSVSVGGLGSGVIESVGDQDVFAVSFIEGETYHLSLNGNTLVDPVLSLLNSSGDLLTSNDDVNGSNFNSYINFTADTSGTYYLSAKGLRESTGSYNVAVSLDDYKNDESTTGLIVDGVGSGNIESIGDQDWFAISLDANQEYQFNLTGGTLKDTILSLYDAHGQLIQTNDDVSKGYFSQITYTPSQSDVYYLAASGYGDNAGTYNINVFNIVEGDEGNSGHVSIDVIGQSSLLI